MNYNVSANPLPQPICCVRHATVVPFGDSFLLVGGYTPDGSELSTIYRYEPDEDRWTLLDGRMKEGKENVIAMMIDVNMINSE